MTGSISMSTSGDSSSCASAKRDRRQKKRSSNDITATMAPRKSKHREHNPRNGEDEIDEAYGFGCVGCGRWRHDAQDPFGVKSVLRTMIQDKFSSRVDFSEEAENKRRRYPIAVNFVEHRL